MRRRFLYAALTASWIVALLACVRSNTERGGSSPTANGHGAQPVLLQKPAFDEKEMEKPLNEFREYPIEDHRKLPNCLDVFEECAKIPHDGKTEEQYKAAVLQVARQPCRVVLELVDVSANYDYAEFKILTDGEKSGIPVLARSGNLANYTRHLKEPFAINNAKAKGLGKNHSIGARVVLVGLGDVVSASPWGAGDPKHGMPRGDSRYVMLRAFGKPSKYRAEYEFSFMVRNWYFAAQ